MQLKGKTIAVTGATGFVGSHIALQLADAGADVVGVVRTPAKGAWLADHGVRCVAGDLTDAASLRAAFEGADAVVSNAALGSNQGDLDDFERVNVAGVGHVMDATAAAGVTRVVHISSTSVYRTRLYRRMGEDAAPYDTEKRRFNWSDLTTDWRYARTKAKSEAVAWARAEALGLALTTLRPSPVYGSRDHKATAKLVAQLKGRRVQLAPTVGIPWVHAADVALAVVGALRNDDSAGNAYNIAGPPVSLHAFLRTLKRELGAGAWLLPLPVPVWVRYDTSAAARDLGFTSRSVADGLAEALTDPALR